MWEAPLLPDAVHGQQGQCVVLSLILAAPSLHLPGFGASGEFGPRQGDGWWQTESGSLARDSCQLKVLQDLLPGPGVEQWAAVTGPVGLGMGARQQQA